MVIFFIVFLVSGFFFLIEAPKWDVYEWAAIWLATPLYFGVYAIVQHLAKKEYRSTFQKSHAIRWSFWVVGVILCIIYAAIAQFSPLPHYDTLTEAFAQAPNLFESSPSALMSEAGIFSTATDGLVNYELSQLVGLSPTVGFICCFAIFATIFFGLVNQFSSCLLSFSEIKDEFRILPTFDEQLNIIEPENRVRVTYIAWIVLLSLAATAIFQVSNSYVAALQAQEKHTQLVTWIEVKKRQVAEGFDRQKAGEVYGEEIKKCTNEMKKALTPLIEEYYEQCESNINSYLEWYDSVPGQFARFLKPFGSPLAEDAEKTFRERITQGTNSSEIESIYQEYQERLTNLRIEALRATTPTELDSLLQDYSIGSNIQNESGRYALDLWQPLSKKGTINDVLLGDLTTEELEQKIHDLIDQAQEETIISLGIK